MQLAILILLVIITALLTFLIIRQLRSTKAIILQEPQEPHFISPLQSLCFEDVLLLQPLYSNLKQTAEQNKINRIKASLPGILSAGAQVVNFIEDQGKLTVYFKGRNGIKSKVLDYMKDAQGKKLPVLVGKNGKIVQIARLKKGQKLVSTAAKLGTIIVGAAHIISAADIAQKLEGITRDVKGIKQSQKNEQLGKLESIFKHAQELMALTRTPEVKMALLSLSKELHELRSAWRRDMESNLVNIENPAERPWLQRKFSRTKTSDKTITSEIQDGVADFIYIEASLAIHLALFYALDETDVFFSISLPNELKQFRDTLALLEEKAKYLSSKYPDLSADQTIEFLKNFIARHEAYIPLLTGIGMAVKQLDNTQSSTLSSQLIVTAN